MDAEQKAEALTTISLGLAKLMDLQEKGAKNLPEHLHAMDEADFRTAALGFFVELGELVNEAKWKPWRDYGTANNEEIARILDEAADVLHFLPWLFRNLEARFGITAGDLAEAFVRKHEVNIRRFRGEVEGREPPPNACCASMVYDPGVDGPEPSVRGHHPWCPAIKPKIRRIPVPGGARGAYLEVPIEPEPTAEKNELEEYCRKCGGSWSCLPGRCTKETPVEVVK